MDRPEPCKECGAEIVEWQCEPIDDKMNPKWLWGLRPMKPGSTFHVCANGHRTQQTFVPEDPDPILESIRRP